MPKIKIAKSALQAALVHFSFSAVIAGVCAAIALFLWYPTPFDKLASGREILLLLIAVDVICGPLLTLIVFDTGKSRRELYGDLSVIAVLQIAALSLGLFTLAQARPVWLAFEGDRFRLVTVPEIQISALGAASEPLRRLSWSGPKPLGVKLLRGEDPGYRESIQLALEGLHPSFRPERWLAYETQVAFAIRDALPIERLYSKHPDKTKLIDQEIKRTGLQKDDLAYFPLVAGPLTDWTVLIGKLDGMPKGYLPLDSWE